MIDALNFVQNQAGAIPPKVTLGEIKDQIVMQDVISRVRMISRAFDKQREKQDAQNPSLIN